MPFGKQAARIVVRCLLDEEQHDLEETAIPENSFSHLFTQDWLKELNVGRHGRLLSHCVLTTEQCVVKVPWDQVAYPEFEDQLQHMDSSGTSNQQDPLKGPSWQGYSVETRICPAKDGIAVSLCLVDSSRQSEINQAMPGMRPLGWVSPNTWDSRSKECFVDEDVDNVDFIKEKHDLRDSQTCAQPRTCLLRPHRATPPVGGHTAHDRPTCGRTVRFAEQPCTPCLRRKHGQGTKNQECRYKEYCREEPCSVRTENRQKEPILSERTVRRDHHRKVHDNSQGIFADMTELSKETNICTTPPVVETESDKSHNIVQGCPSEGKTASKTEMIPSLHVAHGKKTTTFGLVSPKLNRRKPPMHGKKNSRYLPCFLVGQTRHLSKMLKRMKNFQIKPSKNRQMFTLPCLRICVFLYIFSLEEALDHKNLPLLAKGHCMNKTASSLYHTDIKKTGKRSPFPAPAKPETCLLQAGLSCLTG